MSDWKTYKLGDLGEILNNKRVPLNSRERAARKGIYPYYGASAIVDYIDEFIFDGEHVLISEDGENLRSRQTPIAFKANGKFWVNNHAHIFKGKDNWINDFIVHYFQNIDLSPYITGAVQPKLNKDNLLRIPIRIKNMNWAKEIAQILTSLDDKIELNLQMNQTLEAMAQALFKEWFVNFNFPNFDGELENGLPKGWRMVPIGELFKLTIGGDWGKEELSDEFSENSFVVRGTDFDKISNGNISSVPNRFIKQSNFIKRKIENGDILLEISGGSKDQPTGRTLLFTYELLSTFNCPVVPASFCRLIRPLNYEYSLFLDIFFKFFYQIGGTWEYQNQSTGISNFQFTFFSENKKIALPESENLIYKFSEIIKPMKKRIDENTLQIQTLTQTRDTLLPKLMSGKIKVSELGLDGLNDDRILITK